jgi:DNA-binding response OmpR family regulator
MNVNYLSMNDSSQDRRDEWVNNCFKILKKYRFSIDATSAISRAQNDYDVLVIGGLDTNRISKFIKANIDALRSIPKIAVVDDIHPSKRAKLLMAGYDDIWDIERMLIEEASARIVAISSRYAQAEAANSRENETTLALNQVAIVKSLSERERTILLELIRSPNRFCSYARLQSLVSDYGADITTNNLKVIISNLRKKLRPGIAVTARQNAGYHLDL